MQEVFQGDNLSFPLFILRWISASSYEQWVLL